MRTERRVAVAELEAGMISARTRSALAAAKAWGKKLGGPRIRLRDGRAVLISHMAQKRGAAANRMRAVDRAADLAPTIAQIRATGATTLAAIAEGLNAAAIVVQVILSSGFLHPLISKANLRFDE
jgi:DNA invertase Pin-like site-specific DNA recombinase